MNSSAKHARKHAAPAPQDQNATQDKSAPKKRREFDLKHRAFGAMLIPVLLTLAFFASELLFKSVTGVKLESPYTGYIFFFTVPFALIIYILSTFFTNSKINTVILWVIVGAVSVLYSTQLIYTRFFGYFLTLTDVGEAEQIAEFWKTIVGSIFRNFFTLLVFFLPLILLIVFRKSVFKPVKTTFAAKIVLFALALLIQSVTVGVICSDKSENGDRHFYKESYVQSTVGDRFGVLTMVRLDFKYLFVEAPTDGESGDDPVVTPKPSQNYNSETKADDENEVWYDTTEPEYDEVQYKVTPNVMTKAEFEALAEGGTLMSGAPENVVLYEKKNGNNISYVAAYVISDDEYQEARAVIPDGYKGDVSALTFEYSFTSVDKSKIDYGYNVIDAIDFEALLAGETNSNLKKMHTYFSTVEATQKNEYTGMFEGKNLIYMTCESFSHAMIDKDRTPTLYKMWTEGFVFKNYYVTDWAASTGGGEFCMATGLCALKTMKELGTQLMQASANRKTYLPFTLGNIMKKYGYTAKSYHDHNKNLYEREASHKLWGFDYKYIGHGLTMQYQWPCSDKDMVDATFEDYANSTPFVVDYMTISGHGDYNAWTKIAKKNKAVVESLKFSDPIKIYLSASMELEYAMETLLADLEEKGILEDTFIVMAPDHWPYCLTPEYGITNDELSRFYGFTTDDTFERYHNALIIWSASMKKPVVVEKPCSSYDILPTVLNLLGVEYDSRLLAGRDILSSSEGVAITKHNKSWVSALGKYNASTGKFTAFDANAEIPENYVSRMNQKVKDMINYSQYMILYNYYKAVFEKSGLK